MDLLTGFVTAVGNLATVLSEHKEYGFIAVLVLYHLLTVHWHRKDMNKAIEREIAKDARVGELLEHRHKEFTDIMERSIVVLNNSENTVDDAATRINALEHRVDGLGATVETLRTEVGGLRTKIDQMDTRCQTRQDARDNKKRA